MTYRTPPTSPTFRTFATEEGRCAERWKVAREPVWAGRETILKLAG